MQVAAGELVQGVELEGPRADGARVAGEGDEAGHDGGGESGPEAAKKRSAHGQVALG